MIGSLNPFMVTAAVTAAVATSPINVRSTSAATETANNIEWLYWNA
jgi:hypothetical protein